MIAAWMIYTAAIALLLYAGACAAEHLARAIGAPTRFVWAAAMLAVLGLSGRALLRGVDATHTPVAPVTKAAISTTRGAAIASRPQGVASRPDVAQRPNELQKIVIATQRGASMLGEAATRFDVGKLEQWNLLLVALWVASSSVALLWLAGSAIGLRRIERRMEPRVLDGLPVLVSHRVGPALFGVVRPRTIIPEWVLALPASQRRIILAHEREHATAFDPVLLCAAALAVAVQPWNVGLWSLLARLRLAVESDCDRRVLGATGDARGYGRLLLAVYERATSGIAPSIAFVERPSNLERRIRRMTRRPRLLSIAGGGALLAMSVLSTAAWTITPPARPPVRQAPVPQAANRPAIWRLPKFVTVASPVNDTLSALTPQRAPAADSTRRAMSLPSQTSMASAMSVAAEPCGTGARRGERCVLEGEILVRLVDSSHVVIAIPAAPDTNATASPALHVFLVTTVGAARGVQSGLIRAGHAEFQDGSVYIVDRQSSAPGMTFGNITTADRNAVAIAPLVGIASFMSISLTFERIRQLRPTVPCSHRLNTGVAAPGSPARLISLTPRQPSAADGNPLIIVDGVVVSPSSGANLVGECAESAGLSVLFP